MGAGAAVTAQVKNVQFEPIAETLPLSFFVLADVEVPTNSGVKTVAVDVEGVDGIES